MKKYITAVLCVLLVAAWIAPTLAWLGSMFTYSFHLGDGSSKTQYFAGGDGSVDNPYIIKTPEHLYNLAWLQYIGYFNLGPINNGRAQSYFKLSDQLRNQVMDENGQYASVLSETTLDMSGYVLPPIGTTQYPFLGIFDGNGKVIANLKTANAQEILQTSEPLKPPTKAEFDAKIVDKAMLAEYLTDANEEAGAVMGFFGVIGDYDGAVQRIVNNQGYSSNEDAPPIDELDEGESAQNGITTYHKDNETILYTQAIGAKNFALNEYTLRDDSIATTIGVAAGYVNASLEGVALNGTTTVEVTGPASGKLSSDAQYVSDYTLVGYCTEPYQGSFQNETVTIYKPMEETPVTVVGRGDGDEDTNYGGSVAMSTLFNDLDAITDGNAYEAINGYVVSQTRVFSAKHSEETPSGYVINNTANNYYNRYNNGEFAFVFTDYATNEYAGGIYKYTAGGSMVSEIRYQYSGTVSAVKIFTDGIDEQGTPVTHYFTAGKLEDHSFMCSDTIDVTAASAWVFEGDQTAGSKLYVLTSDGYKKYLNANGTTLSFSDTGSTNWFYSEDTGVYYRSGNTAYYLTFIDGAWKLINDISAYSYYRIASGSNYLVLRNVNGAMTLQSTENIDEASLWRFSESNYTGTISTTVGSRTYYLSYERQSQGWFDYIGVLTVETNEGASWRGNGTNLYASISQGIFSGSRNYYLVCESDGAWSMQTTAQTLTFEEEQVEVMTSLLSEPEEVDDIIVTMGDETLMFDVANEKDATYIPLQMQYSGEGNNKTCLYKPMNKNTGYITSGIYDTTATDDQKRADVRISRYESDSIADANSLLTIDKYGRLVKIPTNITTKNNTNAAYFDNLQNPDLSLHKYADSVDDYNTMRGGNYLYGLHFMNGVISTDSLVTIPLAKINGTEYENYQVPGDCIDFNLKEQGYINFFAGTYFSGNNSFFSLHHIVRNTDQYKTIKEINEIAVIYTPTGNPDAPYIYEYEKKDSGGNTRYVKYTAGLNGAVGQYDPIQSGISVSGNLLYYTVGNETIEYEIAFKTSWLKGSEISNEGETIDWTNCGYYFEIPVDAGEYALGSVDGQTGAYLVYLDIGAALTEAEVTVTRTVIKEIVTETTETYFYANGVAVVNGDGYSFPMDPEQHTALGLTNTGNEDASYGGTITLSHDGSRVVYTADGLHGNVVIGADLGDEIYLKNGDTLTRQLPAARTITVTFIKRVTVIYTYDDGTAPVKSVITYVQGETPTAEEDAAGIWDASTNTLTTSLPGLKAEKLDAYAVQWDDITETVSEGIVTCYMYQVPGVNVTNTWVYEPTTASKTYTVTTDPATIMPNVIYQDSGYQTTINGMEATVVSP